MRWDQQVLETKPGMSLREAVDAMNAKVVPCPERPRRLGFLWRPRRHRFDDITTRMNTLTYATLERCRDCGLLVLGSGL